MDPAHTLTMDPGRRCYGTHVENARLKRDEAAQLVAMGESPAQKKQRDKIAGPEDTTVAPPQLSGRLYPARSGYAAMDLPLF